MNLEVVPVEHTHVPAEALHPPRGAGRRNHQVEEFMRVFEAALGLAHQFPAEPLCELGERSLEVRGQLPGVPPGRPAGHTVALDEQHPSRTLPQEEERRRDSRDPGADDHDIGSCVAAERPRRAVRLELGDPRRTVRPIRVEGRVARPRRLARGVSHHRSQAPLSQVSQLRARIVLERCPR